MFQLPPVGNHPDRVEKYLKRSLNNFGLEYVDLYLVHVPFGFLEKGEDIHPVDADGNILLDKSTNHINIWKVQYFTSWCQDSQMHESFYCYFPFLSSVFHWYLPKTCDYNNFVYSSSLPHEFHKFSLCCTHWNNSNKNNNNLTQKSN